MVNILFVAWEFPPLSSGGVQRPLYFVKYLRDYGVNPIVITVEDFGSYGKKDYSLLFELPKEIVFERIKSETQNNYGENRVINWFKIYFGILESQAKWWQPYLNEKMDGIIATYKPLAIFVTIPPFSMGPLWGKFAKKYKLPLIIDFRDGWSQWNIGPRGSWLHYQAILFYERNCLKNATKIICTSQQIAADLINVHPKIDKKKFEIISNGFDREIDRLKLELGKNKFIIGYVGAFYYSPENRKDMFTPWWKKKWNRMVQYTPRKEDWLYRSPYFFFKTLSELFNDFPDYKNIVQIKFAGSVPDWLNEQILEFGLTEVVHFQGFLNHEKVIEFQKDCDALLLTSSKVIGGRDYSIAGKTFEYFSLGKPILSFVCDGAQKDILESSGVSIICDPDNIKESKIMMKKMIDGEINYLPNINYLKTFKRKRLAQKLAEIIKRDLVK